MTVDSSPAQLTLGIVDGGAIWLRVSRGGQSAPIVLTPEQAIALAEALLQSVEESRRIVESG
jgi:hypothetical protein